MHSLKFAQWQLGQRSKNYLPVYIIFAPVLKNVNFYFQRFLVANPLSKFPLASLKGAEDAGKYRVSLAITYIILRFICFLLYLHVYWFYMYMFYYCGMIIWMIVFIITCKWPSRCSYNVSCAYSKDTTSDWFHKIWY